MGLVLKCLFKFCCDVEEDQTEIYEPGASRTLRDSSARRSMSRGSLYESQQSYQIAPQGSHDDDDDNDNVGPAESGRELLPRHPAPSSSQSHHSSDATPEAQHLSIHEFFRRLRDRFRMYDSLETFDRTVSSVPTKDDEVFKEKPGPPPPSPLRQASTFDSSKDIPVIHADEIVLPGSILQQEMSKHASKTLGLHEDECVICMEGFDATNPRMPTLCGCGENKTYFHLPCLYSWVEQCPDCPSCRKKLTWEEF